MDKENSQEQEIQKKIELMKENCIFCKIVKNQIESKKIFEDDICIAILDIAPATNGHLLLMPKEHYMLMPMVPDEILGHLTVISKMLGELLKEVLQPKDISIFIANGAAAGQNSQHFMIHVIPRYEDDKINFNLSSGKISGAELEETALKLREKLQNS